MTATQPMPPRPRLGDVVLWAVWAALAVGLAQVLFLAVKKYVIRILVLKGEQVVWMAPVSYLMVLVPMAFLLWLLARTFPRIVRGQLVAAVLVGVGLWDALHVFDVQVGAWPISILAAGVGVQTYRLVAARPDGFARLTRRTVGWLAAVVALLGVTLNARLRILERRAVAALPAARQDGPNVLLLILDTVRGLSMQHYGHPESNTPELSRLAGGGVTFDRAVTTTSWTGPSHASIFTGLHTFHLSTDWSTGLDKTHATLAEVMRDHGYVTGGFVANTRYLARDGGLSRGFIHYEDFPLTLAAAFAGTWVAQSLMNRGSPLGRALGIRDVFGRKGAPDVIDPFLRWADQRGERPFFAMLNFMDAHDPYVPPEPFASAFGVAPPRSFARKVRDRLSGRLRDVPAEEAQRRYVTDERDRYEAAIAYLDAELGRLFRELEGRGLIENTLIILTADHGEEFDEHGVMGHGKSLYWPSLHVPLMIWFDGRVPRGVRIPNTVGVRSIAATVTDLLDLEAPASISYRGGSLARYWSQPAPPPTGGDTSIAELSYARGARSTPASKGDMKSVTIERWHYIRNGDGSEELYDTVADPWEMHNLVGRPEAPPLEPFRDVLAGIPQRIRSLAKRF